MLLYGRNSVLERIKKNPGSISKIFLQDNFELFSVEKLIKANNIPVERLSSQALARIKQDTSLQGIVARVEKFKYAPFDDLLNPPPGSKLALVFLDRIYDPQNLGAIIRSAACFGGFAIVIPRFKACEVNETVLHVASGGENYVQVSMVSNLSNAIMAAKKNWYWIVGAQVSEQAKEINQISLPFPLGLVLGSEGKGIRYGVEKHLDIKLRIPMPGAKLSFNVTAAFAILCYEVCKQRCLLAGV